MSAVRGRACQCCAAAKRRCTGERPCKRCISLCATIEEASLMCIELPDRRTKAFVAQRKRGAVSGVKRSARPRTLEDFNDDSMYLGSSSSQPQVYNISTHSRMHGAEESDDIAFSSASKRRAVAEQLPNNNARSSWAPFEAPRDIKKDVLVKAIQQIEGSMSTMIQEKFRNTGSSFSAFTEPLSASFNASSVRIVHPSARTAENEPFVRANPVSLTPLTTSAAALEPANNKSANEVVDSIIRAALAKSPVATLQISFDTRTKRVSSCYGNDAWTSLFGITSDQLSAFAVRGEIPQYVHAGDVARYSSASLETLRAKNTDQVITARFVGAAGRTFVAQEASQLEYNPDGTVKRITLYYNEVTSPVARNQFGGITISSSAPSEPLQPVLPRASFIPLDASLSASIESAMKMIQEEGGLKRYNSVTSEVLNGPSKLKTAAPAPTTAASAFMSDADWPVPENAILPLDKLGMPQLDPMDPALDDFFAPSDDAPLSASPLGADPFYLDVM